MKTKSYPTEKTIGDFTVRVEADSSVNGPFAVRVHGGPAVRTLDCRFETEAAAAEYLSHVSSRTLAERKF